MKKMMYFAAALLVLVGCQKKDNSIENTPKEVVTIKGSIELPQSPNKIAAPEGWESAEGEFGMRWEENDQIYIYNGAGESSLFTIASGAGDSEASFNGSPLSSMEGYNVAYGYDPTSTSTEYTVSYIEGNYRPFAEGTGIADGFSINNFSPVIGLQLKGESVTLSKIEVVLRGSSNEVLGVFTMPFEDGLALDNTTATKVYFPLKDVPAEKLKIRFYEKISSVETLIMTKSTKMPEAGKVSYYPELEIIPFVPTYVDLGLSVKWATCNVGATKEEEYGDYFAWGEIDPYYTYLDAYLSPQGWKEGKTTGYTWQSYCGADSEIGYVIEWSITPYDAATKILKPEYDAATDNWGDNWRMPTKEEQDELYNTDNCTWEWKEDYNGTGVKGYVVKSIKNGNSIFLPAAGYLSKTDPVTDDDEYAIFWSSLLGEEKVSGRPAFAYAMYYVEGVAGDWDSPNRCYGQSVRPVCK